MTNIPILIMPQILILPIEKKETRKKKRFILEFDNPHGIKQIFPRN